MNPFIPLNNGWGIIPLGPTPEGGDFHETFHVDLDGNILGGHTTAQIPGYPNLNVPWDGPPSDSPSE